MGCQLDGFGLDPSCHARVNCAMLSLWALSWGFYHTAASPGLLPSLLEKSICLAACQQHKLGKISHRSWKLAALIMEPSHVVWGCSCWVLCAFDVLWHQLHVILRERTDLQWFTAGRNGDATYSRSILFAFWQQGSHVWLFPSLPKFSSIFPKGKKRFTCSLLK